MVLKNWLNLAISTLYGWAKSFLLAVVSVVHTSCGWLMGSRAEWKTLFHTGNDAACVVRATTTFGFDERVQVASLRIQQHGSHNLYRVMVDGDFVVDRNEEGPIRGDCVAGAIYLPDASPWLPTTKKCKGENTKSLRGRSFMLTFPANAEGLDSLQITFIYPNESKMEAKEYIGMFEAVWSAMVEDNNNNKKKNDDKSD
ncbi:unknown protein [Seminavis robusta]|uniref:Uncharacterized protein n=1 Tax=Seminavis robusta TaxID=568900 RepID=A0A9N8F439_9STRA|nr:unknown protein [Seminavis robusta]|eukprot:Sro2793_g337250.1 n/a (199) ;mRNA; r:4190-4786